MASIKIPLIIISLFVLGFNQANALDWKNNRVAQLEKITVGPWDNFSASIANNDSSIYFTRDSNQISNIYYQDLKTADVNRYIGEEGDAKQAVLNPNGNLLAITYYQYDSQGDICLVKIVDKAIECITTKASVDQTPFWITASKLGFIRRQSSGLEWELVEYDLSNKQSQVLVSGFVSAPIASPDGRYILFNQLSANETRVQLYDRQTKLVKPLEKFELSGLTGFFSFSKEGKFVYFNHYLNDTNADQKIDGSDHSVVFRIPTQSWFTATKPLYPEQLTSVKDNCKFPAASNNYLYVTCAFEGSLDIYRLSLTGVVPVDWNEAQVWEAHNAARSYEQRLLLLNTLRYRFGKNDQSMLERILSNHLEIGELTAARYYINELALNYQAANKHTLAEFYINLGQLVDVRSSKQRVPVNIVTARFQNIVEKARQKFQNIEQRNNLSALLNAQLDYELENYAAALKKLQSINFEDALLPLERYLIFELYKQLLLPEQAESLLVLYPRMFNEKQISAESRLYYAFSYLKLMSQIQLPVKQRIQSVTGQLKQVEFPNIKELFESELLSLAITEEKDQKEKGEIVQQLQKRLNDNKQEPLLRRAMHTRAILNLGQANEFNYMEALSRNWLTVTHISEMEFVNVAEQYSAITMNKAYGFMAKSALTDAYSIFYSAIRQTNDLEAHYQFVTLGLTPGLNKKDNLEKSYEQLKQKQLIGSNEPYVKALQLVIAAESKEKLDSKLLDEALLQLENMRASGLNPSMRDLLMGYIYHQKLRATQEGYAYDKSLFQRAHYHYMMALDLAQDNARIAATVWQNLGWLQFEVRQYGLAADFFLHRLSIPFVDNVDEVSVRWMLARTMFYNNQKNDALAQAEKVMALVTKHKLGDLGPYLEKSAFYAMQAEDYSKATLFYEQLFSNHSLSKENQAKSRLAYAYALKKNGKQQEAITQFKNLVSLSDSLKVLPKNNQRLIAFYPQRFQLLAYGFLAELSKDVTEQISYRQKRIELFKKIAGKAGDYAYDEAGRLSFIIKDYQQIALANEKQNQFMASAVAIHEALLNAEKWMEETGDEVGPVIFRTLLNYLSLNISHKDAFSAEQGKNRDRIVKRVFSAFENHPYRSSLVVFQHNKMNVLWLGLQSNQSRSTELDKLLNQDEIKQLQKDTPQDYEDIETLVKYFK